MGPQEYGPDHTPMVPAIGVCPGPYPYGPRHMGIFKKFFNENSILDVYHAVLTQNFSKIPLWLGSQGYGPGHTPMAGTIGIWSRPYPQGHIISCSRLIYGARSFQKAVWNMKCRGQTRLVGAKPVWSPANRFGGNQTGLVPKFFLTIF